MRIEKLRDLIARLHALPRRRLTLLVGVDGTAGAGKTTFTRALVALDPGLDVIQMDDFGLPTADREAATGRVAAELDWRRLRSSVLLPLSRDQPARYQRYDPATDAMAEWRMVPVGGILIVEGRYACVKALTTFYDFRIWVDSPREVRLGRLERLARARLPAADERAWLPAEEAYVAEQDPARAAHLRVDGSGAVPHDPAREYVRLR
ncbi:MAG TPA: uridine kinase [Candidatus Dormibacteraeota bacterium]|nr:uridine kinase [Candidatus Dormibacteraeota bacterium]